MDAWTLGRNTCIFIHTHVYINPVGTSSEYRAEQDQTPVPGDFCFFIRVLVVWCRVVSCFSFFLFFFFNFLGWDGWDGGESCGRFMFMFMFMTVFYFMDMDMFAALSSLSRCHSLLFFMLLLLLSQVVVVVVDWIYRWVWRRRQVCTFIYLYTNYDEHENEMNVGQGTNGRTGLCIDEMYGWMERVGSVDSGAGYGMGWSGVEWSGVE